ncbi:MAG TPA: thioredoxin fold domain-containing protein [Hyphomicrobiaceae bacterium]|jgi:thioredoxin-related protein|nr:thioredoxin fold domain-containing protein [Hyphomicrobiaceae bacterium]
MLNGLHGSCRLVALVLVALALVALAVSVHPGMPAAQDLPPPVGPEGPRVAPRHEEQGLYSQSWFQLSFLDLREDFNEARAEGKRFAVIFEQRGCPYCAKLHTEILALKYINDYLRENFRIVQLDLWGAREVTDFDGARMPEKVLAERWGVIFTPTVVFFKDDLTGLDGKWGRPLEAIERLPLSYGQHTFYDLFVWVRLKLYEKDRNFQRFHISRIAEREALQPAETRKGN